MRRYSVAKLKQGEKRVQLSFQRPEDVVLYERLSAMAYERRYSLPTFLLLALQDAFRESGTDVASHPPLPEPARSTPVATDMGFYQSHRNSIAASVHQQMQSPSDPPE